MIDISHFHLRFESYEHQNQENGYDGDYLRN